MYIVLVLLQVVILNHISFLTYATPFLYLYFILKLPIAINRNLLLILGFFIGFTIDLFTKTPGINAAATTFISFIRRPVMSAFFMSDETEINSPAVSTMGWASFSKYALVLVFLHSLLLIVLESFSFFNLELIIWRIIGSTLLSLVLILALEGLGGFQKR